MRYFEDFNQGESETADAVYHVTADEIIEVGKRWDPQPFHIDPEAAAKSMFGSLVAPSALLFSIHTWFGQHYREPIAAVSGLGFNDIKLHAPVRPGDRLSQRAKFISTRLSQSKPGCGILEAVSDLINQDGELVFSVGTASLIQCRP